MKALCIKKFVGRWVNITLKTGIRVTVLIKEVTSEMGIYIIKYCVMGSREPRLISRSEILDIYA